jgi:hypothetical protein
MDSYAASTLVLLVVIIVVFLICREIVCWYWKITQMVDLLREISAKLGPDLKTDKKT